MFVKSSKCNSKKRIIHRLEVHKDSSSLEVKHLSSKESDNELTSKVSCKDLVFENLNNSSNDKSVEINNHDHKKIKEILQFLDLDFAKSEKNAKSHDVIENSIKNEIHFNNLNHSTTKTLAGVISLFSNSRFLPTLRIKIKSAESHFQTRNAGLKNLDESSNLQPSFSKEIREFFNEKIDIQIKSEELQKNEIKVDNIDEETCLNTVTCIIPHGSLILVEGSDTDIINNLVDHISLSILSQKHTLTYISTKRDFKQIIDSMFPNFVNFSRVLSDMRLLIVPVYPLIHGEPAEKSTLFDKLCGSPQLFEKESLVLNRITDFLEIDEDRLKALKIWPFLRKLTNIGKVVLISGDESHPAMTNIREACNLRLRAVRGKEGKLITEVMKSPTPGPTVIPLAHVILHNAKDFSNAS
ncbi:MAG: hypothetical protein QW520_07080 [Methanomassiliicoccales archaeon]